MPTVLHRLARWAEEAPSSPAQRFKKDGKWQTITAREYCDRIYHLALFLRSHGLTAGQCVAIFASNSPEWVQLELATVLLGARSAGVYPNATLKEIQYILDHCEARMLGVGNKNFFKKLAGRGDANPPLPDRIQSVIVFDGDASISPRAIGFETALKEGRKLAESGKTKKLEEFLSELDPDAGMFMIYTSGTTGNPKGALLSHDNFIFTADAAAKNWDLPGEGSLLSFLPLCHVAEKLVNLGICISQRYLVSYCGKTENVAADLVEVQPTLLLCVPRLWEKMMENVLYKVERSPFHKRQLAYWALSVGARMAEARHSGYFTNPVLVGEYKLADRLVLSNIRRALGLGEIHTAASGAAALPIHVAKWFQSIGIEILEDFGQTESTGVICMTVRGTNCVGTVGRPVVGMEVRIAEDGEILTRGRHVFKGYFKDDVSTSHALNAGWLHTGDLGEITHRGYVRIMGRKKDIIKTSGGKMVAPLPIEEALKASRVISHACVVGDGRKYLSALVTLSDQTREGLKDKFGVMDERVITLPEITSQVKSAIDQVNRTLSSYEQIKRFAVLSREFSIADGEMTPTLKMKRNVIEERYRDVIEQLYPPL